MTEGSKPENEQPSYDAPFVEPAANPPDAPPEAVTEAAQAADAADVTAASADSAEPAEEASDEPTDDGSMSLIAHLTELRARLIKCVIAITLGSGVGYYFLVKFLVKLFDGTIAVESEVGKGTRFLLRFPKVEGEQAADFGQSMDLIRFPSPTAPPSP